MIIASNPGWLPPLRKVTAFAFRRSTIPGQVERVDLSTGHRSPVRELAPRIWLACCASTEARAVR